MSNKKADKIRLEIMQLSDEDILNFQAAVYSGDWTVQKPFESAAEYMKRTADTFKAQMPF
jgi:hypothetical protein